MIGYGQYSSEIVDLLYTIVEEAVEKHEYIDIRKISPLLRRGDFYLYGDSSSGLVFAFDGLKWVRREDDKDRVYICLIAACNVNGCIAPVWEPVITVDDREHCSSGDLSMIKKENRYTNTDHLWDDREETFKKYLWKK